MTDPTDVNVKEWPTIVPSGSGKVKVLQSTGVSSGSPRTLHDVETGADYQVPVGKKFLVTAIMFSSGTFTYGIVCEFWNATTADTANNKLMDGFVGLRNFTPYGAKLEFTASRYPTIENSDGVNNMSFIMIGIEEDA